MSFLDHSSRDDFRADPAAQAPQEIDLAAGEWNEEPAIPPAGDTRGLSTILSFWAIAALLLIVIAAAPALEAAAHHLH